MGPKCVDHRISAAHFQLRINRYYAEDGRPPLREAFFVVTMPVVYQRELLFGCPGLVVLSHVLLAEVRLHTHPREEAEELIARAQAMLEMPELGGAHTTNLYQAWPLAAAFRRYEQTRKAIEESGHEPLSVDFVLPHCGEDLSWLSPDAGKVEVLPPKTRIFVYEKCGMKPKTLDNVSRQLTGAGSIFITSLDDPADPHTGLAARRDECSAYLAHLVHMYRQDIADVTIFLHADPADHTPFGLLNLLLRALALGTLRGERRIGFLHLGSPRLVHTANACQEYVFHEAMSRPLKRPLSTYCCSQFAVGRERLLSRPLADYHRALRLVDGSVPDLCERIGPSYEKYAGQRLSHCFFLEFMWHVVFGEGEELPLRADDRRLPPAFRLKDNEEDLPSLWSSYISPYVGGTASFWRQGFNNWYRQLLQPPPDMVVPRAQQLHYGDMLGS